MKILIAGIPGTGKTTIGDYLQENCGYTHLDMESGSGSNMAEAWNDPDRFVARLQMMSNDVVVTWGFVPNEKFIALINRLKTNGFKVIWLDGNRESARRAFVKRAEEHGSAF